MCCFRFASLPLSDRTQRVFAACEAAPKAALADAGADDHARPDGRGDGAPVARLRLPARYASGNGHTRRRRVRVQGGGRHALHRVELELSVAGIVADCFRCARFICSFSFACSAAVLILTVLSSARCRLPQRRRTNFDFDSKDGLEISVIQRANDWKHKATCHQLHLHARVCPNEACGAAAQCDGGCCCCRCRCCWSCDARARPRARR